jgi:alkylation response protein AidB-like acyl-CoA dehydrogenase
MEESGAMTSDTVGMLYTAEEVSLRDTLKKSLAKKCPPDRIIDLYDGQHVAEVTAWQTLSELGLVGLLIDEALGGAGGKTTDAGIVLEELGYAAAPVPFLASSVIATTILTFLDDRELLKRLAAGEVAILLLPADRMMLDRSQPFRVEGEALFGSAATVAGAAVADLLLVPVSSSNGVSLHVVESRAVGVSIERISALDMTRALADVTLEGAPSRCASSDSESVINHALTVGAALATSDQLGIAQWCLDQLLDYILLRHQFGRPIGSFQAIKHRMADLWVEVELMRTAARHAAATAASDELLLSAHLSQSFTSDAAVHIAEETIQLHAGIAMTWEHPAHVYLKRAKASQIALGRPALHRKKLGERIDVTSPI